ncbi:TonB-dependent receptor plug domain-containing protein [Roseateles amylovorans]|uniref:TonB-dependent receptor n=1 Tax=Roseateles amylovorans TaxID=2978473 RepID=A0ABY6B0E1_9BURK|nr:TonB-dependent receptor [Roseateles amylovorans]UXH77449.1 TonB-dependent receptor [Roseateles amylovorans]
MISPVSRIRPRARSLLVHTPSALASAVLTTSLFLGTGSIALAAISSEATGTRPLGQLDEVTVTGTRSPMRLADVLGDLTVLNRADIERQGYGNVADLLRNRAGVEMTRNGGPGTNTSLFVRGAESRHTIVLIDGVRVESQSTGGADWQNLPLSQIERVEVLKGPASALYGSDAIGGVVQIFTRKGSGRTQLDMGVGAGNLGQVKADIGVSGGDRRFDYAASLSGDRGTGFNGFTNAKSTSYQPDKDGWRNYSASLRLGGQIAAGHRLEVVGLKSRTDSGYDAGKNADDRTLTTSEAARAGWSGQWSPALSTQLDVAESRQTLETKPSSPYLSKTRIRTATLQGFYKLDERHQINALVERREDRLDNTALVPAGSDERHDDAIGLSYLLSAGAFSLQAHGRHDDDSDFGRINTGTLAAGYRLGAGWRVTAAAGNAFRAPTLYQMGSVYGPNLSLPGVAPLRAERGHNREIGLAWEQGDLNAAITTYHNRVSDLIAFGAAGTCRSTVGCYGNVARATLQGTSLKAGAQLGPVGLSGQLDFSDPTDDSTGKTLQRRAKRFGSVRADFQPTPLPDWAFGATWQGSGSRWDNAANTTRLGGYGLWNLDARYSIAKDWRLQLNVDNLFDRRYMTANNYAQAPRTWFVMLRYSPSL